MLAQSLMMVKTQFALFVPSGSARRLRRLFSFIEAAGLCYRVLMPTPLWFHWLHHAAGTTSSEPSLWTVGISHLYVGFKLVALVDRVRRATESAKAAVCLQLPVGQYASASEMMELGEDGCTICQEEHSHPVRLQCGHIYCEECITSWCERSANATCPLCRASIPSALGLHSDGTTSLLPQIF